MPLASPASARGTSCGRIAPTSRAGSSATGWPSRCREGVVRVSSHYACQSEPPPDLRLLAGGADPPGDRLHSLPGDDGADHRVLRVVSEGADGGLQPPRV